MTAPAVSAMGSGLAAGVTFLICLALGGGPADQAWGVLTALAVVAPWGERSPVAALRRALALLIGAGVAIALLCLTVRRDAVLVFGAVFVIGLVTGVASIRDPNRRSAGMAAALLYVTSAGLPGAPWLALGRLPYVVLGAVTAIALSYAHAVHSNRARSIQQLYPSRPSKEVTMFAVVVEALERLPRPLVPLLPMIFTIVGPGLLIWLLAFHIPVHYPQETMAPYPDTSPATMELGRPQALPASASVAGGTKRDANARLQPRSTRESTS